VIRSWRPSASATERPGTGTRSSGLGDANIAYEGRTSRPQPCSAPSERRRISIKLDLAQETSGPGACGAVDDLVVYDARLTCHEPDPTYTVTFSEPFQSDPTQGVVALLIPCLTGACP